MAEGQSVGISMVSRSAPRPTEHESGGLPNAPHRPTALQEFSLFAGISPHDLKEIIASAHEQVYSRREAIYLEGDLVRTVMLVTSGLAKVVQFGRNGTEVILRLDGPGEFVGTTGLCPRARYGSRAQAVVGLKALVWESSVFEAHCQRLPVLRRNSAQLLCRQLEDLEERFRLVSTEKVSARLSNQLIRLVKRVGQSVDGTVELSLSREELAQLIGTTLFTVSRLLSDWDERGIVRARREAVSVRNLAALTALSDGE